MLSLAPEYILELTKNSRTRALEFYDPDELREFINTSDDDAWDECKLYSVVEMDYQKFLDGSNRPLKDYARLKRVKTLKDAKPCPECGSTDIGFAELDVGCFCYCSSCGLKAPSVNPIDNSGRAMEQAIDEWDRYVLAYIPEEPKVWYHECNRCGERYIQLGYPDLIYEDRSVWLCDECIEKFRSMLDCQEPFIETPTARIKETCDGFAVYYFCDNCDQVFKGEYSVFGKLWDDYKNGRYKKLPFRYTPCCGSKVVDE